MAYPMEFRAAVAAAYDECGSSDEVAAEFNCSASWVRRLIQRRGERGTLEVAKPRPRPEARRLDDRDHRRLARLIAERPDMTLGELAEALQGKASVPTVFRATRRLGLSLKKSPCAPKSRTARKSAGRGRSGSRGSPA